jgi:hypothetical protein
MKTPIRFLFTLLCAAIVSLPSVHAATTWTVQNTGDGAANAANCPGSGCRLRDALAAVSDGDTIDFSVTTPATITLTSGELLVDKSITITGPGADQLSVNGNAASRVFHVGKTATISGLTITNGSTGGSGGGIYNDHATLTVSKCTLSGNSNDYGGGIYNDGDYGSATLTINNSTVSGNSASSGGGGIYNIGRFGSVTLTINNSTLSGNLASSGGGIYNYGGGSLSSATLTINNSTLNGNSASSGGGIYNNGQFGSVTLTINNSTLSGNSASSGGGISNIGYNFGSASLNIGNTILNAGTSGANIYNNSGTVTSDGYNLSSDNGGGYLTATGDQINTDPMLGPLQDNGGPTFTHELLTGSPAINMGDPNFTPPPDYDQRGPGYPRVVNGRIDIGAFEVQASAPCPQPQGYWKNNPGAWPVTSLTLGSQTYTKTELLKILKTATGTGPKADASLILADQLIAAKLNIANGSDDPAPVPSTITHADSLLSGYSGKLPYKVKTSSANGQAMVNDASVLNNYNNAALTPGCTP